MKKLDIVCISCDSLHASLLTQSPFIAMVSSLIARLWVMTLMYSLNQFVDALCLSLAGPIMAQLKVYFSSAYL